VSLASTDTPAPPRRAGARWARAGWTRARWARARWARARWARAGWARARWADLALVVVLAGAALRIWQWAANRPLWLDEQMISMNLRSRGFAALTGELDDNQSAPLGWLWLQRLVVDLFGTGERALRLVPLLFGVGTLVAGWLVARRYLGPVGAVALVGFLAVNAALVRYSTEVKQYSADAFWVLVLLGLAAWVAENPTLRRAALWWAVAAVAGWLSMGAILAVPGLALVLFGVAVRRRRWWPAVRDLALPGVVFLAAFAVHYQLSLRFAAGSDYLADFWDGLGYPPQSGPLAAVKWLLRRPEALAADPLHLDAGLPGEVWPAVVAALFWLLVAAGLVLAARHRPAYGLLLATPVAVGLLLAVLRVVPLATRLALWLVPVLLVAAAVALDAAARVLRAAVAARGSPGRVRAALAAVAAAGCLALLVALVPFGASAVSTAATRPGVDDRAAVAWMRSQHRQGDLVLVVGSATRARQWYDHDQRLRPARMVLPSATAACDQAALRNTTKNYARLIVYSGIRLHPYKDAPAVLDRRLGEIGTVVERRTFGAGDSIVYLVELRAAGQASFAADGKCLVAK
jgi:Dolichyl-phosphate-mannose-protein mannosyltransferase